MRIFTGMHIIQVERDETMQDGFSIAIAEADGEGNPTTPFSRDNTKIYGGNWRQMKMETLAEIIRHLLP